MAHAALLPPSLEDIDSINFALGLRDFNPAEHQPHPPGYPIYIAAGKLSLAVVNAVGGSLERVRAEALALSIWSAIAGALAIVFASRVFGLLADVQAGGRRVAFWATVLVAVCPLFWLTGARPMSDMPGLAVALATQALLLSGRLGAAAFLAGLALGIRSQTLWLTAPLLALQLYRCAGPDASRDRMKVVALAAAGALCWAVPLLVATGGVDAYLAALGSQGAEDFASVDMLWSNPTPRRLAFGLVHTLVLPWSSLPLAAVMIALALTGTLVMLLRERLQLGLLVVAFVPYAAFHLIFQETITVRYALPIVVPIAFLAARALTLAGPAANLAATPVAVIALLAAIPTSLAYARDPHPAFRAIADAARRAEVDRPGLVTSHFELRRPLRAVDPPNLSIVYAPRQREWLELTRYWLDGGRATAWFLANPRRTDLDLIDRHSRRDVVRYQWRAGDRAELSGTRPANVDWYRLRPPTWFAGEGWSLTPETGGVARATETAPDFAPVRAHVRRYTGPMHAVIGGGLLDAAAGSDVQFDVTLNGASIDRWVVAAAAPTFLRFIDLPAGVSGAEDSFATLQVRTSTQGVTRTAPVAIRQFDIQPISRVIFGFGPGWHEEEYENGTGLRWRWMSDRGILRVRTPGAIRIRMRGDSPLKYFAAPPTIAVTAGGRTIQQLQPSADWEWEVLVPAHAVAAAKGDVAIETSRVFVPAEIMGSPDTRRLGLRIFALDVESAR